MGQQWQGACEVNLEGDSCDRTQVSSVRKAPAPKTDAITSYLATVEGTAAAPRVHACLL
jgi:hypothetical protein